MLLCYTWIYLIDISFLDKKMSKTAKVFMSGRSQAVRLPKEFRFDTKEVWIRRNPDTGEIILKPKPDLPEGFQNGLQVFMHEMAQLRQELGNDWEPLEIEPREPRNPKELFK